VCCIRFLFKGGSGIRIRTKKSNIGPRCSWKNVWAISYRLHLKRKCVYYIPNARQHVFMETKNCGQCTLVTVERLKDSTKRTGKLCEVYSAYNPRWIFWESKLWKTTAESDMPRDMPRKIIAVYNGDILSKQKLHLLWKDLMKKR
jgi:hypothetical protein